LDRQKDPTLMGLRKQLVWALSSDRRSGSGRSLAVTPAVLHKIRRKLVAKKPRSQRQIARDLNLSVGSINLAVKKLGLKAYRHQRVPGLSAKQKKKRLQFARKHRNTDWSKMLFIHEKKFEAGHYPNKKSDVIYAKSRAEVPTVPVFKYPGKVNIIAGIAEHGRTKVGIFEEKLNKELLLKFMKTPILHDAKKLFPEEPWTLVMDSDPKHTAGSTYKFLDDRGVNYIHKSEWPANSPDLNPIENVFSLVMTELNNNPPRTIPSSKAESKQPGETCLTRRLQNA
jgi:DDE superfamily endonuclease/Transposase